MTREILEKPSRAVRFTPEPPPLQNTVHGIVLGQASAWPGAVALRGPRGPVTYANLDDWSGRIAAALVERGAGPGRFVAVALDRSTDTIAGFLGVLRAGAAYCPLDLQDPPARQSLMLRDAGPRVILTTRRLAGAFAGQAARCLCLEDIGPTGTGAAPRVAVDADAPAALMYTSGSTGRPKGTLVPHRGIVRLLTGNTYAAFGRGMRTLFHSPPHFDASTFEIWGPLFHGGGCGVFQGERVPSLQALGAAVRAYGVNCLFLGPALFNVIVDEDARALAGLREVLIGGEAMSVRHVRRAMAACPGTRFVNVYGPTETTTFATTYLVPVDLPADARSVPIGRPIAATTCHLLDDRGATVPDGDVGELYIGGRGVALGYANRPELTAARFLPDPRGGSPSARMYRTGDLCRRLPDGNLDFVGRRDDQLKLRGHRVELGEIEAQLGQHSAVAQCVVVPARHAGHTVIVAYYTVRPAATCAPGQALDHLRQRLPSYLIPRAAIPLPALPVGPSGAVDRAALPAPDLAVAATSAAPTTPLERHLLDVWREVLDEPAIGIDDGFFDMGGTSLDAMRLCLSVERATGQFVPISTLLTHATVRAFARATARPGPPRSADGVVRFSDAGDRAPVYLLGGDQGHPLELRPLATALSVDRPIYGLQLPGLDGVSAPVDDVRAAARHLLPTVRRLSGDRPVHLVGYCYGGLVAYEMAGLLRDLGAPVGQLILIDSWTAASRVPKPFARRVKLRAAYHLRRGPVRFARRVYAAVRRLPPEPPVPPQSRFDELVERVRLACAAGFARYAPGPYGGEIVSVRAGDECFDLEMSAGSGGWDAAVGRPVLTWGVPGDHTTMLRPPHVATLARVLEHRLAAAE